jgi:outer membrane protein assembly factor BamB
MSSLCPRWSRWVALALFCSPWCSVDTAAAGDWPRFRGPNGSGVSLDAKAPPTTWSDSRNLKWKLELPGPGLSCPIVVGDKVFVTCWTGYAVSRDSRGEMENLARELVCVDRATGKRLWSHSEKAVLPEDEFSGMFAENGYASHTPVSDGKRVFAFFGKSGLVALDLQGKVLWKKSVGEGRDRRSWGSSSSPILFENLVIVPATVESHALIAFDQESGKEVWRQEADGLDSTWGSPILVPTSADRTDLVLAVPFEVWGMNPATGKLRWFCTGVDSDSLCSSAVADGDTVFVVDGRNGGTLAVRAGGKDDVTKSHVVWSGRDRGRIASPLVVDDLLYWVANGIVNCADKKTGVRVYQSRLGGGTVEPEEPGRGFPGGGGRRGGGRGGQDYSSPVAAHGHLYYQRRSGECYVVKLGREFHSVAMNRFEGDTGDFHATPAISDGQLFIRSTKALYCIAE